MTFKDFKKYASTLARGGFDADIIAAFCTDRFGTVFVGSRGDVIHSASCRTVLTQDEIFRIEAEAYDSMFASNYAEAA